LAHLTPNIRGCCFRASHRAGLDHRARGSLYGRDKLIILSRTLHAVEAPCVRRDV